MVNTHFWKDKTVFITGASSGLGLALVEALAPLGVKLGLVARREAVLQELAERFRDTPSSFWVQACDVRDRAQVESALQGFSAHHGHLDMVWVNSGVGSNPPLKKWDWEQAEALVDTNIKGAMYTIYTALKIMENQTQGTIVGIGSAASMRGLPGGGLYSLTKISLHYLLESLTAEAPHVKFITIHPGFVDTPINQGNPGRVFLMQPPQAARLMLEAVEKGKPVYIYPRRMAMLYHGVHALPHGFYRWLIQRLPLAKVLERD